MPEEPVSPQPNPVSFDASVEPVAALAPPTNASDKVTWTASEYIAHHKSSKWYATLGLSALAVALLVLLTTHDKISAIVVLVGAAALGGYGARQPRELEYQLDISTLSIGLKQYSLDDFRSFTVDDQQAFASINLMPLKRFAPALTIYFSPDDEDAIINLLALRLPIEEHKADPIDQLMRRIRF